jgi:acyl-CoA synthetase (AMP-forming)/AMP-acid ligase II
MTTFAQRLLDHYRHAPDRSALHLLYARADDQTLTYRNLIQGAAGYARALEAANIQPGDVVVLILQHGQALAYAFYGAILHGAIPSIMPFLTEKLAPEKYRADLAALIQTTQPTAIVTYPEFETEVRAALQPDSSVRAVLLSAVIEPDANPDLESLSGLKRTPTDIVLLQHSSGTTGLQKGVALSHQAVFNQLAAYSTAIRLTAEDVIVSWLPLYHDMGLIAGFVMPILMGVPLVLLSPFDWVRAPYKLMQAVSKYKGTLSWLPNFAYNFCAQKTRDRDLEGVSLASWRAVINCSEPVHFHSHELFSARFSKYGLRSDALATCYAMAENVFAVTQGGIGTPLTVDHVDGRSLLTERVARPVPVDQDGLKMLSCGRPLSNVRVRVLSEQRTDLPERHLGEIALQSDCMLTGYYHREDVTRQAFHEGWYLTGDLGYLADGEVYVTGRKKELIIVGGKNVYPQDLERLASGVAGVHPGRVVAFGIDDEEAGTEDVVVVAEADTEDETERQQIADAIRQRVTQGSDVALRRVQVVGPKWLIKTSSGKPARLACKEKYLLEVETEATY